MQIAQLLSEHGAKLSYHDALIPEVNQPDLSLSSIELSDAAISSQDLIVITAAHTSVDYARVVKHATLVFDTRNATNGVESSKITRLGDGTQ